MAWIGAAISGGASLLGGMMSSDAAGSSSDAQSAASAEATAERRRQYNQTRTDLAPFRDTGVAANARLRQLLGLDTAYKGADSGSMMRRFSAGDLASDTVYQSGLDFGAKEGRDAINARAIANGGYDSGATLKALMRFGNDYGSTKANESYNRFNTDNTNTYNRLAGVSGAGQTATNTIASEGANAANNIAGSIEGAGNARAAGIVGGANAWGNALGGVSNAANSYTSNQNLQKLLAGVGNNSYNSYSTNAYGMY